MAIDYEKLFGETGKQERETRDLEGKVKIQRADIAEIYTTTKKGKVVMQLKDGRRMFKHPDSLHITDKDDIDEVYAIPVCDKNLKDDEIEESDVSFLYKVTKKKAAGFRW